MKFNLALLSFIVLLSTSIQAEESPKKARWYQVNLTFFQQKPDLSLDEAFSFSELKLNMADAIHLHQDNTFRIASSGMNAAMALHHENANGKAFNEESISLDWEQYLEKLDPVTQPILYNAQWTMPVYDKPNSLPIYFESSVQKLGQPQLKGVIELHVSRYLHSKINLQYIPEIARHLGETISLQQKRRMRSKEIHYMDHPFIAALIRILPAEHPLDSLEQQDSEEIIESALNTRL
ncbi:MAG: CsiV family protein [Bermanella sp.]